MLVYEALDDPVNLYRNTVHCFNQIIPESLAFWLVISKLDPNSMIVNWIELGLSIELGFSLENTIQY